MPKPETITIPVAIDTAGLTRQLGQLAAAFREIANSLEAAVGSLKEFEDGNEFALIDDESPG